MTLAARFDEVDSGPPSASGDTHHGTHRGLLQTPQTPENPTAKPDAIIVPTARPADRLGEAITLSHELDCSLVVLCSMRSSAGAVVDHGRRLFPDLRIFARDVGRRDAIPRFTTKAVLNGTRFARTDVGRTAFTSKSDLGFKRNVGWLMSRMLGWRRVMFLDDDIVNVRVDDVRAATSLLDRYPVVGLANAGFPDNSVVCHAYRAAGGKQSTFIGGGALLLDPHRVDSFFADVYNEDWLFLQNMLERRLVAVLGAAPQERYDPFASPQRARYEEFGDTLAEGLYTLLDENRAADRKSERFWDHFITNRRRLIRAAGRDIRNAGLTTPDQDRMIACLRAAAESSCLITPRLCTDYLAAWETDRIAWISHAAERRPVSDPEEALTLLTLSQPTRLPIIVAVPVMPSPEVAAPPSSRVGVLSGLLRRGRPARPGGPDSPPSRPSRLTLRPGAGKPGARGRRNRPAADGSPSRAFRTVVYVGLLVLPVALTIADICSPNIKAGPVAAAAGGT